MIDRRNFTKAVAAGAAAASLGAFPAASASAASAVTAATGAGLLTTGGGTPDFGPLRHVRTDLLDVAYVELGPPEGDTVLLYHGWPYSHYAYAEVAPELARHGYRVLVPILRGHGPTRFLSEDTVRSGQQAALGSDVIAFMDALDIPRAIFGGYDWGGRGLNVACALWPERCTGLVSVNSYLIQNLNLNATLVPDIPETESAHWYYYYFLTRHGRNGLAEHTKDLARVVWTRNSPQWNFTEADLDRAAALFDNPDYIDVVINCYRVRLHEAPTDPRYDALEALLLQQPPITVPAVTLDGLADGSLPATDGTASAIHFTGPRVHHQIPGAGHNLPQEAPRAFVDAVLEVAALG
jgi:pimeloyl-ACP methyl ester carboxylesterase